jgi:hypothetical protein
MGLGLAPGVGDSSRVREGDRAPEGLLEVSNDSFRVCSPDTRRGISTEGLLGVSNDGRRGDPEEDEGRLDVEEDVRPR